MRRCCGIIAGGTIVPAGSSRSGATACVADPRRDLYAHAFVLLAIASYVGATGNRRALSLADETLAFLDDHMASPDGGGFVEQLPPLGGVRRQNPHMHLFEALLALWECSRRLALPGARRDAFRALRLAVLPGGCRRARRVFHGQPGSRPKVSPAGSRNPAITMNGSGCCAGSRRPADVPTQRHVDALYSHADRHGFDERGTGRRRDAARRLASQAIAPHLADDRGDQGQPRRGAAGPPRRGGKGGGRSTGLLLDHFLPADLAGGWLDRLEARRPLRAASSCPPARSITSWGRSTS